MVPKEKSRVTGDKPFPWRCPNCLKKATVNPATIQYRAKAAYDGRVYEFDIPELIIPKCESCGELVFSYGVEDQIAQALRSHLRLLSGVQIRNARKALGLSQKDLGTRVGSAEASISRWETGGLLQSRATDNLLRVFFASAEVQRMLCGPGQDPLLGTEHDRPNILSFSTIAKTGEEAEVAEWNAAVSRSPVSEVVFPSSRRAFVIRQTA